MQYAEQELPQDLENAMWAEGFFPTDAFDFPTLVRLVHAAATKGAGATMIDMPVEVLLVQTDFCSYTCQASTVVQAVIPPPLFQAMFPPPFVQSITGLHASHHGMISGSCVRAVIDYMGKNRFNETIMDCISEHFSMPIHGVMAAIEIGAESAGYKPVYSYTHVSGLVINTSLRHAYPRHQFTQPRPRWPDAYMPDNYLYQVPATTVTEHQWEVAKVVLVGFEPIGAVGDLAEAYTNLTMSAIGWVRQGQGDNAHYNPGNMIPHIAPFALAPTSGLDNLRRNMGHEVDRIARGVNAVGASDGGRYMQDQSAILGASLASSWYLLEKFDLQLVTMSLGPMPSQHPSTGPEELRKGAGD